MDGRRQPARIQVSVGEFAEPALDPGGRRLDFPVLGEDDEPGRVWPVGIAGLADQQPRARTGRQVAAIISWSPPIAMFMCQLGLDDGSPPVASWRVETPASERATSEMWWTSSP